MIDDDLWIVEEATTGGANLRGHHQVVVNLGSRAPKTLIEPDAPKPFRLERHVDTLESVHGSDGADSAVMISGPTPVPRNQSYRRIATVC